MPFFTLLSTTFEKPKYKLVRNSYQMEHTYNGDTVRALLSTLNATRSKQQETFAMAFCLSQ